jgi:hypothetical protein
MKALTKEQAIEISRLHFQYADEHPNATREELQQAFYQIKAKVLSKTRLEAVFKPVETL